MSKEEEIDSNEEMRTPIVLYLLLGSLAICFLGILVYLVITA
jgi:hypothetical protein